MSTPTVCPLEELVLSELKALEVKILYKPTNILQTEIETEGYRSLVPELCLLISRELLCSMHFLAWNAIEGLSQRIGTR